MLLKPTNRVNVSERGLRRHTKLLRWMVSCYGASAIIAKIRELEEEARPPIFWKRRYADDIPVTVLELSPRLANVLYAQGIRTIGDLYSSHPNDWLSWRNFGKKGSEKLLSLIYWVPKNG